jgi:CBS domain-containing protein
MTLGRRDRPASEVEAREAMTVDVVACHEGESIAHALERMREYGVRRLVVLGSARRLEGVISLDDIAIAARSFEQREPGAPLYLETALTLQGICVAQVSPVRVAH